jgi:hypothetical protein
MRLIPIFMLLFYVTFIFSFKIAHASIKPKLDVAQFQDAEQQPYLEIYYSIPEPAVMYVPDDKGNYSCQLVMDLQIFKDQSLWASKVWKIEKTVEDTAEINEQSQLVDMIRYLVEVPASYRVVMHIKDLNQPDRVDSVSTEIVSRNFSPDKLDISDVELALNIKRVPPASKSVFKKSV